MGQANRKRQCSGEQQQREREDLVRIVQKMHDASPLWNVTIIYPWHIPTMIKDVTDNTRHGDENSRMLLLMLQETIRMLPQKRPLCFLCNRELIDVRKVAAWGAVFLPAGQEGSNYGLMNAICFDCAIRSNLTTRFARAFRRDFPGMELRMPHSPGHA